MSRKLIWSGLAFLLIYSFWPAQQPQLVSLQSGLPPAAGFDAALTIDGPPLQSNSVPPMTFSAGEFTITPAATFQIEARVLGRKDYRSGTESELSPVDLALGWGPMADPEVLDAIRIRQSNRFYYWSARTLPLPAREIETSSANMHLIPADEYVADQLASVREQQTVRLLGYLVNVDRHDGWRWRTSLTRSDTGAGACELLLVQRVHVL
jgi:hypothetical protein